jgi:hypothetical protein
VGAVVLLVALVLVTRGKQLGDSWNPDEWYSLGVNLAAHHTVGFGTDPTTFRPPGYPAFVAVVLEALVGVPDEPGPQFMVRSRPALYLAHALVLALAAGVLTWWWTGVLGPLLAAATALALALNPHFLVLVGLPHYALLHALLLLLGSWALAGALGASRGALPLLLAGALWGGIALLRPVTLPLPFLLWALLLLKGQRRRALSTALWLALGMALVVAPWTMRNAQVRGRLIPVNSQVWTILYTSSSRPFPVSPDHSIWMLTDTDPAHREIYESVTGERAFRVETLYRHEVELEDAYRARALENLRTQPRVYAANAARFLGAVLFRSSGLLVKLHEHLQRPGARLTLAMMEPGSPQTFERSRIATAYKVVSALLLVPAAFGLVGAWRRGDPTSMALLSVLACVLLAHALTWMDLLYYYVRVPFLLVFAALGLRLLDDRLGGRRGTHLALALLASLVVLGLGTVAVSLLPSLADWS